ncbi:hypothetical protein Scep_017608 [Stephania cephalantha]|uniref:GRF-type domain-containing protein n=1 Tax=Stephania cephalantha TaxID=152367 RepID=A0AAP0NVT8_9MAGN
MNKRIVKKECPNKGRTFLICNNNRCKCFQWDDLSPSRPTMPHRRNNIQRDDDLEMRANCHCGEGSNFTSGDESSSDSQLKVNEELEFSTLFMESLSVSDEVTIISETMTRIIKIGV